MVWATRVFDAAARPDTSAGAVGNRWQDAAGIWSIAAGRFVSPPTSGNAYAQSPIPALLRPASESPNADVRVSVVVRANATQNLGVVLHKVAGNEPTYLLATVDFLSSNATAFLYVISNGSPSEIGRGNWSETPTVGEDYLFDVQIVSNAVTFSVIRTSSGNTVAGASGTLSAAQAAGACGIVTWNGTNPAAPDDGTQRSFGAFKIYNQVPSSVGSVSLIPASFQVGVATPFTLTGSGTSWDASTLATLISGGYGATLQLTGMRITGQVISGFLNPGSLAGQTLTIGTSSDPLTATASVTAPPIIGKVTFDGDSLTAGQYTTGEGTINAARVAVTMTTIGPAYVGQNIGVSGQTISQMQSRISSYIAPFYDSSKGNYLVAAGGHNDINIEASSRSNTQASADIVVGIVKSRIQSYVAAVLAACPGMRIVWATQLPAGHPQYPSYFDYARDEVNKWVRGNFASLGIAAISDVACDPTIGQSGDEYDSRYFRSVEMTHPTDAGAAIWGRYDYEALRSLLPVPGATPKTVSVVLTSDGTTPRANLAGLRWAFFDQPVVGGVAAPTAGGSSGTTDASGRFSVAVMTTLAVGGTGWLVVTDSDGTVGQDPPAKAFAGPVAVAA